MQIQDAMRPVLRRLRINSGLSYAMRMLFFCGVVSTAALLGTVWLGKPSLSWYSVVMLCGLAVGAFLAGFFKRFTLVNAAIEIDKHYGLQDRLLSALEFERMGNLQPIHELQLTDAKMCASQIDPSAVVPLRMTCPGWVALMSAIVITSLAFEAGDRLPERTKVAIGLPDFKHQSQRLAQQAQQLDDLAVQQQDTAIAELAKEMKDAALVLEDGSTELGDVLEEYSRLQDQMRDQLGEYDAEMMQTQLKAIAKALSAIPGLENMSQALGQWEFEAVAQDLESFNSATVAPLVAEGAAMRLQEIAEELDEANLESLSKSVEAMREGLAEEDPEKTAAASKELAAQVRKLGKQTRTDSVLQSQLAILQESKVELVHGQSVDVPSPKPQQASSEIGSGIDGELDGEDSQLETSRQQMELAGTVGAGASSVETSIAQEDDAQAKRTYREVFQAYEKQSRAVLDAEPIPLGHRQAIRRYFKLIRPVERIDGL